MKKTMIFAVAVLALLTAQCKKIEPTPEPGATPTPVFSIAPGKTIVFSPGLLYWNGNSFGFEANQWTSQPANDGEWNANHVNHFYYSNKAEKAYALDYDDSEVALNDIFFTNDPNDANSSNPNFFVNGESGWRVLTKSEWDYLLDGRPDGWKMYTVKTLTISDSDLTIDGAIILPDGCSDPIAVLDGINTTDDLVANGAVFFPCAGSRTGKDCIISDGTGSGNGGFLWSSTPYFFDDKYAAFSIEVWSAIKVAIVNPNVRENGYCARLVRDAVIPNAE